MGHSEYWIELRSQFIVLAPLFERFGARELPSMMNCVQVSLISSDVRDIAPPAFRRNHQFVLQDCGDRSGDFVLHCEYIGKFAVVTLRPQVESVSRTDQL